MAVAPINGASVSYVAPAPDATPFSFHTNVSSMPSGSTDRDASNTTVVPKATDLEPPSMTASTSDCCTYMVVRAVFVA